MLHHDFRRYYIPNSVVFITQVVHQRVPVFRKEQFVDLLRKELHETKALYPFAMEAFVFLPDHFHMMIRPVDKGNFSKIMQSFKPNFTKEYKKLIGLEGSLKFWQKRFYDHVIQV